MGAFPFPARSRIPQGFGLDQRDGLFPENSQFSAQGRNLLRADRDVDLQLVEQLRPYFRFGSLAQLGRARRAADAMRNYFVSLIWTLGSNPLICRRAVAGGNHRASKARRSRHKIALIESHNCAGMAVYCRLQNMSSSGSEAVLQPPAEGKANSASHCAARSSSGKPGDYGDNPGKFSVSGVLHISE